MIISNLASLAHLSKSEGRKYLLGQDQKLRRKEDKERESKRQREATAKSRSPTFSMCLNLDLQLASSWKQKPRESLAGWRAAYLQTHCKHKCKASHAVVYLHSDSSADNTRKYEDFCGSVKIGEEFYRPLVMVSDLLVQRYRLCIFPQRILLYTQHITKSKQDVYA